MATNRNSTMYAAAYVNKYLVDNRNAGSQADVFAIPFQHTIVSGETGGSSAGVQDTTNLCVLPANCRVIGLVLTADALWASAAVNGTLQLGDSGDDDRYMTATELYTATPGGPIATEGMKRGGLADTGQNYEPAADTIVVAKYKTANPTVGKIFKGAFICIAGY